MNVGVLELRRPSNVLVADGDGREDVDMGRFEVESTGDGTAFVVVSLAGGSPSGIEEGLELLRRCGGSEDEAYAVTVGSGDGGVPGSVRSVSRVKDPGDMSGLSMSIGEALVRARPKDIYLCFDDLDMFLDCVDLRSATRFLNALTGRLRSSDGVGYFLINPERHDERTVESLSEVFDRTVGDFGTA